MRRVVWICFFEKLADYGGLEERLSVVFECWDQTARVEVEERFGFVVRVDFDVLVWDFLFFENGPGSLDEGTADRSVSHTLH